MPKITRNKAVELIESSRGKFFTVTFTKKDNSLRTMNCNYKKSERTPLGYINVYSMGDKNYRNVNPQTISKLIISGTEYTVK